MNVRARQRLVGLGLCLLWPVARADEPPVIATVAVVGDADRLSIGQEGYCGPRTQVSHPTGKKLELPAEKRTFLYMNTTQAVGMASQICHGDFSFVPHAGLLYILRFTVRGRLCQIELFRANAGGTPVRDTLTREEPRSCLLGQD